jgi:two-component system response regulator HupR/HoxA
VAELSAATQVTLLRVLQDGEVRRVGNTATRRVDVRLICATNRHLEDEVAQGRFREDLYYRLYALVLALPVLRERADDLPLLVRHVLTGYVGGIGETAMVCLQAYAWPGNVRELENQLATAKALAGGCRIEPEHLWPHVRRVTSPSLREPPPDMETDQVTLTGMGTVTLKAAREQMERFLIAQRLTLHQSDLERVATSLGVSKGHLYELIHRYGLA